MKSSLQAATGQTAKGQLIQGGHAAAELTVQLMSRTFGKIAPRDICNAYDSALRDGLPKGQILSMLWEKFGDRTVEANGRWQPHTRLALGKCLGRGQWRPKDVGLEWLLKGWSQGPLR